VTAPSGLVLLDTNVVLFLVRGNDFGRRINAEYNLLERPDRPLISVVNVGELLGFARYRRWGDGLVAELRALLDELVIVDINEAVVEQYAFFHDLMMKTGKHAGQNDLWIAATAAVASATLITTDGDFDPLAGEHLKLSRFLLEPGS
jgi:tRNA(fMet)-specific endonuclease VapC